MCFNLQSVSALVAILVSASASAAASPEAVNLFRGGSETPVKVSFANSGVSFPASRFPCQNCHGKGAQGQTEGSSVAPAILPSILLAATSKRPAYDAATFHRLLERSVDSGGRTISPLMPQYQLSGQQAAELMTYLQNLEASERSGVHPDRVVFGFAASAPPTAREQKSLNILRRELDAANRAGLPFGRRIELVQIAATGAYASRQDVFGTISIIPDNRGASIDPYARPLMIFPDTVTDAQNGLPNAVFHSLSLDDQLQTLFKAMTDDGHSECVIAGDQTATSAKLVLAAQKMATTRKVRCTALHESGPTTNRSGAVLLLGTSDQLLSAFGSGQQYATVYGLLDMLAARIPVLKAKNLKVRLVDPHPALTAEALRSKKAVREAALERAVKLIVEGLRRAGRDLTRQRFLSALSAAPISMDDDDTLDFKANPATGFATARIVDF